MKLEFHRAVQKDFTEAVDYYERGGPDLADRFEFDVRRTFRAIRSMPLRYARYLGHTVLRRAHLSRFPYVVVFKVKAASVRIMVLKHEKRDPRYGLDRR